MIDLVCLTLAAAIGVALGHTLFTAFGASLMPFIMLGLIAASCIMIGLLAFTVI